MVAPCRPAALASPRAALLLPGAPLASLALTLTIIYAVALADSRGSVKALLLAGPAGQAIISAAAAALLYGYACRLSRLTGEPRAPTAIAALLYTFTAASHALYALGVIAEVEGEPRASPGALRAAAAAAIAASTAASLAAAAALRGSPLAGLLSRALAAALLAPPLAVLALGLAAAAMGRGYEELMVLAYAPLFAALASALAASYVQAALATFFAATGPLGLAVEAIAPGAPGPVEAAIHAALASAVAAPGLLAVALLAALAAEAYRASGHRGLQWASLALAAEPLAALIVVAGFTGLAGIGLPSLGGGDGVLLTLLLFGAVLSLLQPAKWAVTALAHEGPEA